MVGEATLTSLALIVFTAALPLAGCGAPQKSSAPAAATAADPAGKVWYGETIGKLRALTGEAEELFQAGKQDPAAALILKGQPLANRLIAVPRPTFEGMEAAAELDDLYARMLVSNRNYGWARMFYQKNYARWKNWKPQSEHTAAYLKRAREGIATCDKGMEN